MKFKIVQPLAVEEITEEDLHWFSVAAQSSPYGHTGDWVLEQVAEKFLIALRIPNIGIVLIQILEHPGGKELYIWGLAGKGIFEKTAEIYDDLRFIAKVHDCEWIGATTARRGVGRVYERLLEAKPFALLYKKEID